MDNLDRFTEEENKCDGDRKCDDDDDDPEMAIVAREERKILKERVDAIVEREMQDHKYGGFWQTPCLTNCYELLSVAVYLADFGSSAWLTYRWFRMGHSFPLTLYIIYMIYAGFTHWKAFSEELDKRWQRLFVLPFAPVVPLFMWISRNKYAPDPDENKMERFVNEKRVRHAGFIRSALLECVYISIVQMATLVYFNELDIWYIISLCSSVVAFCWSVVRFSSAVDRPTFMFHYLSIVCDYVTILCFIPWLLCNQTRGGGTADQDCRSEIGLAIMFKTAFFSMPVAFLFGSVFSWLVLRVIWQNICDNATSCLNGTFLLIFGPPALIFYSVGMGVMVEMPCYFLFSLIFDSICLSRFLEVGPNGIFWGKVVNFVHQSRSNSDAKLRVMIVMDSIFSQSDDSMVADVNLRSYVRQMLDQELTYNVNDHDNDEIGISWSEMREQSMHKDLSNPWTMFVKMFQVAWDELGEKWNTCECWSQLWYPGFLLFCIHVLSRVFNIGFVWYGFYVHSFDRLRWINCVTIGLLGILQLAWMFSLMIVIRLHFKIWHIFPGHRWIPLSSRSADDAHRKFQYICDLYGSLPYIKQTHSLLEEYMYNRDVVSVIAKYLPSAVSEMVDKSVYNTI